ncbi:MAG: OmpA family protein [Candidatus Poribacteria bacterium]
MQDEDGCPDDKLAVVIQGQIAILQPILFPSGSAKVETNSEVVRTVVDLLQAHPGILQVRIEGHTDSKGDDASNLRLSERRADAVMKALIKLGVARGRLEAAGYGDTRPADSNRTEQGRAKNRRIEFRILVQAGAGGAVDARLRLLESVDSRPDTTPRVAPTPTPRPAPAPETDSAIEPIENPWP